MMNVMKLLCRWVLVCCCFGLSLSWAADVAPDAVVKEVANDVLTSVKQDKAIQSGDTRKAIELVESKVLPLFNFTRMTALAVGKDWRQATPDQKKKLVIEFRNLLVRTYSNALTQYKNQTIDWKPVKMQAGDTDVVVRSEIIKPGSKAIEVAYSLEKTDTGWKIYDVMVAGVSLVTNYRDTFAQEIRNSGIDGLIQSLQAKNQQADTGSKK